MKQSSLLNTFFFGALLIFSLFVSTLLKSAETSNDLLKVKWSFAGLTGKFDRASLQRGYQVYQEVCASCHSMQYLSYRNLGEPGGPEFSEEEVKAIAASFEVTDGPDAQGEMFTRPGRPSDKFVSPYPNVNAAAAANGGSSFCFCENLMNHGFCFCFCFLAVQNSSIGDLVTQSLTESGLYYLTITERP